MHLITDVLAQLGAFPPQIFLMICLFVLTFVVTKALALNLLSKTLIERQKRTTGRENEVDRIRREFEALSLRLGQEMRNIRQEAHALSQSGKARALDEQRKVLAEARAEGSRMIGVTKRAIDEQLSAQLGTFSTHAALIAEEILGELLGNPEPTRPQDGDQEKLTK